MSPAAMPSGTARSIPQGRFAGRLLVPPSKSVTNRYLNLALLGGARVELVRPLRSGDTDGFVAALAALGFACERRAEVLRLTPPARPVAAAEVECGASGTMARFLTASLATLPGRWRLDGTARLRGRPLAPLLAALGELGVTVESCGEGGGLPVVLRGGGLAGGRVAIDAGESSQYVSALLMAAVRAASPLTVEARALVSAPYVELTAAALGSFGARVEGGRGRWTVTPGELRGGRLTVPGDDSAAAYPAAAAALTGGRVELDGLTRSSAQGDRRFLELLADMGAAVEWRGDRLVVAGAAPLRAVEADLSDMPDQGPTLAALAPFARGVTRIRGVGHLRLKESDRLAVTAAGLRRAGARVVELADGLEIPGVWSDAPPPTEPVEIDPADDHRIAMSFAVLGLRRSGLAISDPGVVTKSYPGFWDDFGSCAGR